MELTHMVAYAFATHAGTGTGTVDMYLPNGFNGPETRKAVENKIRETRPDFVQVHVTNVIRYGSL